MARPIATEHFQSLAAEWRRKLLGITWHAGGSSARALQLAAEIGADPAEIGSAERKRLSRATAALLPALASGNTQSSNHQPHDDLDAWIGRHLIVPSSDLLIPDGQRRALLARHRDGARRMRHAKGGMHAARIEMPKEAWAKLRRLAPQFRKADNETVTLGKAMERLIYAYLDGRRPIKPPSARKKIPMPEVASNTLFSEATPIAGKRKPKGGQP